MRYLTSFGDVNVDEIRDVEVFKKMFFADGFEGKTAGFTVSFIQHFNANLRLLFLNKFSF